MGGVTPPFIDIFNTTINLYNTKLILKHAISISLSKHRNIFHTYASTTINLEETMSSKLEQVDYYV